MAFLCPPHLNSPFIPHVSFSLLITVCHVYFISCIQQLEYLVTQLVSWMSQFNKLDISIRTL